jgi:hypothetical protein
MLHGHAQKAHVSPTRIHTHTTVNVLVKQTPESSPSGLTGTITCKPMRITAFHQCSLNVSLDLTANNRGCSEFDTAPALAQTTFRLSLPCDLTAHPPPFRRMSNCTHNMHPFAAANCLKRTAADVQLHLTNYSPSTSALRTRMHTASVVFGVR